MGTEPVRRDLRREFGAILRVTRERREAAVDGVIGVSPQAETVDGRHLHRAEVVQSTLETATAAGDRDDLGQIRLRVRTEGFFEDGAEAHAHLQGGGLGEGHQQDLANR